MQDTSELANKLCELGAATLYYLSREEIQGGRIGTMSGETLKSTLQHQATALELQVAKTESLRKHVGLAIEYDDKCRTWIAAMLRIARDPTGEGNQVQIADWAPRTLDADRAMDRLSDVLAESADLDDIEQARETAYFNSIGPQNPAEARILLDALGEPPLPGELYPERQRDIRPDEVES